MFCTDNPLQPSLMFMGNDSSLTVRAPFDRLMSFIVPALGEKGFIIVSWADFKKHL